MDARELTKVVNDLSDRVIKLEKDNRFLNDEVGRLRLFLGDLQIDVKDIQNTQARKQRVSE